MSGTYIINVHHNCILAVFVSSIWSDFVTETMHLNINVICHSDSACTPTDMLFVNAVS